MESKFAQRLRVRLAVMGMRESEFCKMAGISRQRLSYALGAASSGPSVATTMIVVEVSQMPVGYFFDDGPFVFEGEIVDWATLAASVPFSTDGEQQAA